MPCRDTKLLPAKHQSDCENLLCCFAVFSGVLGVFARERVCDGGGKTRKWSDASNWQPNGVPQKTDAVIFDRTSDKA
jgi:hypothetical protein